MWLKRNCNFFALFCLLLNLLFSHAVDIDVRLCRFIQSCNGNRTDADLKANPCCSPCGCTDDCKEKGTCCHDKEGRNDTKNVIKQDCIPPLHLPEANNQEKIGVQLYYVRTKCPVTTKDHYVKAKCENNIPKTLQDIVFVSSEDGKIVYKNNFCALCHDEHKTIRWQIHINYKFNQCSKLVSEGNPTDTSVIEFILKYCVLIFRRPKNVDLQNVMCFDDDYVINKCNETGLWEIYNYTFKELCENPSAPVYYSKTKIYKNIYCFMCNDHIPEEACQGVFERFPHKSTPAIINLVRWDKQDSDEDSNCRTDQVLDTVFGQCKTLYCPSLSVPINGKCIPFLEMNNSYLMAVQLVPIETVNKSETVRRELITKIPAIKCKLGFRECELCYGEVYFEETLEYLLGAVNIQFDLRQARGCTTESIWSKLTLIQQNKTTIAMTVDKRKIRFHVYWDINKNGSLTFTKSNDKNIFQFHTRKKCKTTYPKHGSYCPKIHLSEMEYKAVLKGHSNVNDLLFKPNTDVANGSVFVCINSYLSGERSAVMSCYSSVTLTMAMVLLRLI